MADVMPASELYLMQHQNWCWPQLTRRSITGSIRSFRANGLDLQLCASIAAILAACMFCVSVDYGVRPRELRTSANFHSWGSQGHPQVLLSSTVASMDLDAGLMTLDFQVARSQSPEGPGYCMQQANGPKLLIGSTVTPSAQVSLDLCQISAEHSFSTVLPLQLQHPDQPQPFDQHTAQVQVRVAAAVASGDQPPLLRHGLSHAVAPSVAWDAMWAAPGLQVAVRRQFHSSQAQMLAAVAAGSAAGDDGGWGSSLHEQLVLPQLASSPLEATFNIHITRSWMVRAMHLTAALVQIVVVAGCCLLLFGQCVCTYLMQRLLLCSRMHGTSL